MVDHSQTSPLSFSRREIIQILFGLILAMFLASLDQTIVATSLSTMAQDLNGCVAEGVMKLLNDPRVRTYLAQ